MRFKDWLQLETRFKGMWRQFRQEHPDMPHYAAKDLYDNRISYTMRKLLSKDQSQLHAPTVSMSDKDLGFNRTTDSDVPSDAVTKIFDAHALKGYQWKDRTQDPIYADPSDFDYWTRNILTQRHFGFKEIGQIRNDYQRTQKQRDLLQNNLGNNEPVIMVISPDEPGKYRLLEGWHRSMAAFLAGSPEEQYNALQDLNRDPTQYIDFEPWRKVPLRAYIGFPKVAMAQSQSHAA